MISEIEKLKRANEVKEAIAVATCDGSPNPGPEIIEVMNLYISGEIKTTEELEKKVMNKTLELIHNGLL